MPAIILNITIFLNIMLFSIGKNINYTEFSSYWYSGKAEITSYELKQARYGELHPGKAVLIYVTEPFSLSKQVKVNNYDKNDADQVQVLKCNRVKKFVTGIYPYSLMTSTYTTLNSLEPLCLKDVCSVQEWCGQFYMQCNYAISKYKIQSFSYFEDDVYHNYFIDKTWLEDEIWTLIRINPEQLPTGQIEMIPSSEYIRLMHKEFKPYYANIKLEKLVNSGLKNGLYQYKIEYPDLKRVIKIYFESEFPHKINGWEETYKSGWGDRAVVLTSTAKMSNSILTDYWNNNTLSDSILRKKLNLN